MIPPNDLTRLEDLLITVEDLLDMQPRIKRWTLSVFGSQVMLDSFEWLMKSAILEVVILMNKYPEARLRAQQQIPGIFSQENFNDQSMD